MKRANFFPLVLLESLKRPTSARKAMLYLISWYLSLWQLIRDQTSQTFSVLNPIIYCRTVKRHKDVETLDSKHLPLDLLTRNSDLSQIYDLKTLTSIMIYDNFFAYNKLIKIYGFRNYTWKIKKNSVLVT